MRRFRRQKRTSALNFKGGTGKSTTIENLSDGVAREILVLVEAGELMIPKDGGVLVLDGDRQRNSTRTLLRAEEPKGPSLIDVMEERVPLVEAIQPAPGRPYLWVAPSHTDLEKVSTYLSAHRKAYSRVRKELEALADRFPIVLLDQAGAYSGVMEALLLASTHVLIPCELEPYSVSGLFDMFAKLRVELEDHTLANAGIIPYNANYSKSMTKQYISELQQAFGELVLPPVSTDVNFSYAQSNQQTIYEYEAAQKIKTRGATDFRALTRQFLADVLEDEKEEIAI